MAGGSTRVSHPLRTLGRVLDDQAAAGPERAEALLEDLTGAQRRAVTSDAAPLVVLAGAGAGKTRVLTRRIAWRAATDRADPGHTLVITFTRKAAGELSERLQALGLRDRVQAGTFHAVAAGQLRRWWADRGVAPRALLERKARLLGPLAAGRPGLDGVPVTELVAHLEWAAVRLLDPDELAGAAAAAGRPLPAPAPALAGLLQRYRDEKRRRGLVDFEDLLALCADAMARDPAFASAQRWRWRHVYVDEFQDVNPLQHRLLTAWLGAGRDLCVVGDPHQAIYGWNGADPRLLATVAERWPEAEVVRLDDNHRCSPQVVAAAAAVLGPAGAALRSTRPDGPAPVATGYASEDDEAAGVAADIAAAHRDGLPWSAMAVLVRTNAQVATTTAALDRAGVPWRAPGRAALVEDPAVAGVVAGWRRHPGLPVAAAATDLVGLAAEAPDDAAAAALTALGDLARTFAALEPGAGVGGLLAWAAAAGADQPGSPDAVTVSSFHRAKGLEWPAVWLCGMEAGLVPIGRATTPTALDEERRLLYVAVTRAAQRLTCTWAATRRFGARPVPREPSPWLPAVVPGSPTGRRAEVVDAETWRARVAEQRRQLAEPGRPRQGAGARRRTVLGGADDAVVAALRDWRTQVARASGVPAHVVLHDRTLEAVAALGPASEEELLGVPGIGPVKAARLGPAILGVLSGARRPA